MAILYCTGPAHIWVGLGTNLAPVYLGTAEVSPQAEINPVNGDVFNDLAGSRHFDMQYFGHEALIQVPFTRWNEGLMASIEQGPAPGAVTPRGKWSSFSVGAFYLQQGLYYQLWMQFPYGGSGGIAPFVANNLPGGYRFQAVFVDKDSMPRMGTQDFQRLLIWRALPLYNPADPVNTWNLYDTDMSALVGKTPD